jgi:hypothetical protein
MNGYPTGRDLVALTAMVALAPRSSPISGDEGGAGTTGCRSRRLLRRSRPPL